MEEPLTVFSDPSADVPTYRHASCGMPLQVHVIAILKELMNGPSWDCEDTYKAIVEVAEAIRVKSNFAPHTSTPELTAEMIEGFRRAEVKAGEMQEARELEMLAQADLKVKH